MDGELTYWRARSGGSSTESLANAKHSVLKALNGGVTDSINSLFQTLFGGELAYWRTQSGLPNASFDDAKLAAVTPIAGNQGFLSRVELNHS